MTYLDKLRAANPKKSDLELEMLLAQVPQVETKTGLTRVQHQMKAVAHLWPDRVQLDWYERKYEAVNRCRRERVKELGFSGSSNSIKTSSLADLALYLWWEAPENTTVYIASPYKQATETNLWARIVEQFDDAKARYPSLPGRVLVSQAKIAPEYERNPLSFIQVITVDDLGKLVGKKSKKFSEGLLIIIVDEAPNLPGSGQAMLDVLVNLRSVPNFLLVYAGNFADTGDFMGKMGEPPGGYESIKGQEDTLREYYTKRGGLVYRFDGHDSINFREGRDVHEFVCTMAYAADIAATTGGTSSPGYMRFIRSFPVLDATQFRVTNAGKIIAGQAEASAHFTPGSLTLISSCDPGFGGGDPCIIQDLRLGIEVHDGRRRQVLELDGPPIVVPIDLGKMHPTETDENGNARKMTPEEQIVAFHKAHAESKMIPAGNCCFDGSMRAGIVHQYAKDWSLEVVPIDPQGSASDRVYDTKSGKTWKEEVFNFASETWFALGLAIQSGQLRGLQHSPAAKDQLCNRPWAWKGDRKQIMPKEKFKGIASGKSPNEADALAGGMEMARRRGFNIIVLGGSGAGAMQLLQKIIRERNAAGEVKRILRGNKLPPGRLHGISLADSHGRRRLNT